MPEVERHPRQSIGGLSGVALFLSLLLRFQPQLHQGGELAREPRSDRGGVLSGCSKSPQQIIILGGPGRASPHHFFAFSNRFRRAHLDAKAEQFGLSLNCLDRGPKHCGSLTSARKQGVKSPIQGRTPIFQSCCRGSTVLVALPRGFLDRDLQPTGARSYSNPSSI